MNDEYLPFSKLIPLTFIIFQAESVPVEDLKHTITGVAIADVDQTLSVYFGCYGELAASGGVGLVRIRRHGLLYYVYSVTSSNSPVFGSNLFLVPRQAAGCNVLAELTSTTTSTSTTGVSAKGDENTATECLCNTDAVVAGQAQKPYPHVTVLLLMLTTFYIQ